jgi:hypothetical protein
MGTKTREGTEKKRERKTPVPQPATGPNRSLSAPAAAIANRITPSAAPVDITALRIVLIRFEQPSTNS